MRCLDPRGSLDANSPSCGNQPPSIRLTTHRHQLARPGRRALGSFRHAVVVLRWFLDGTRVAQLAGDKCGPVTAPRAGRARSTGCTCSRCPIRSGLPDPQCPRPARLRPGDGCDPGDRPVRVHPRLRIPVAARTPSTVSAVAQHNGQGRCSCCTRPAPSRGGFPRGTATGPFRQGGCRPDRADGTYFLLRSTACCGTRFEFVCVVAQVADPAPKGKRPKPIC